MGPNVKFVSAITDAFSNKKNGGQFFLQKRPNRGGGGAEGGLVKDHAFAAFFFDPFPYWIGWKNTCTAYIQKVFLHCV